MSRMFRIVPSCFRKFPNCEITLPSRADIGSAGYDFLSNETQDLTPGESHLFWTDVCIEMEKGDALLIDTRSGNGCKRGLVLRNTLGIIDSSYYANGSNFGNIGICLLNTSDEIQTIHIGDKIAQGILINYLLIDDDSCQKEDREGGFGSSGD
jgi:dUTP pyrophosphatase